MNTNKLEKEIMNLIMRYGDIHKSALICGSEYIWQNDNARDDALELVCDIFDVISREREE